MIRPSIVRNASALQPGPSGRAIARDEVIAWGSHNSDDESLARIIWITGPTCSGMSNFAVEVADHCYANRTLAARQSASPSDAFGVIPNIALQLIEHREIKPMERAVRGTIRKSRALLEKALPEEQLEAIILEPLRNTRFRPGRAWPPVILIDSEGHEVSEGDSCLLIPSALLKAVEDPDFPFRFIFLSNPNPSIRGLFSTAALNMVREVCLNCECHHHTMNIFDKIVEYAVMRALHNSAERTLKPKVHSQRIDDAADNIINWIRQRDGDGDISNVFWLTGPPGIGKTAVTEIVADKCHADGLLAAGFFFDATSDDPALRSTRGFVATIAYQLIHQDSLAGLKEEILTDSSIDPSSIFELPLAVQVETLISNPLQRLGRDSERSDPSTWPKAIVVDGFDKCDKALDNSREEDILSVLIKAAGNPAFPFQIVLASRPELAICDFFTTTTPGLVRELFLIEGCTAMNGSYGSRATEEPAGSDSPTVIEHLQGTIGAMPFDRLNPI